MPQILRNWINGAEVPARDGRTLDKTSPATGDHLSTFPRSGADDIASAVHAAQQGQKAWSALSSIQRGEILHRVCNHLETNLDALTDMVAQETGKATREARGETQGAISLGRFFAGEGQRLFGRTLPASQSTKMVETRRVPCGVAALIVAANTPIANVAWKTFPALICGNGVILKAAEDTPGTAWLFAKLAHECGLPDGALNVIQGLGPEAGSALVNSVEVDVISFTGSCAVGREISAAVAHRMTKVSLELGGKNPFIVCDDCDLDLAVNWASLSSFSNAGQRCAAGSRMVVMDGIYDAFREAFVAKATSLKVGPTDDDDLGPVISSRQLTRILEHLEGAKTRGARFLAGGERLTDKGRDRGNFIAPTIVERIAPDDLLSSTELFGPVATLYRVKNLDEAISLANDSPFGLTAAIHTKDWNAAMTFCSKIRTGMAVVNGGTFGSEPHMPFGGQGISGNGTREPGTEALDIYSNLQTNVMNFIPQSET